MARRRQSPGEALEAELLDRRILVVCGSGGVGKTTTAAALGLRAALLGRRVLVCTIDPSRRLATSLGLARLSDTPRALNLRGFDPAPGGALSAMVLDAKSTFDALVRRHAPSEASRERILENRFYREISGALSGSHEYMAMEKLLELSSDSRFDLVVLDTPPTRHALDFLEAPERLTSFLDTSVLRFFLRPYFLAGRLTIKVATRAGALALKLVDRFMGLDFLRDLSEFFLAFGEMYDGFKERAAEVNALLRDPASAFLLVASPAPASLGEALYFHQRLEEKGMPLVGVVVNRVHADPEATGSRVVRGKPARVEPALAEEMIAIVRDQQAVARADARSVARLEAETGERPLLVPEFEADVHDLAGLQAVTAALFGAVATSGRSRRVAR